MKLANLSIFLGVSLILLPEIACAHILFEGFDNFYNGLFHPVFVPAHLLLLIAIGLFLGQKGLEDTQIALVSFWASVFVGLIVAWFSLGYQIEVFLLINTSIVGLLVAASPPIPLPWYVFIGIATGFLIGLDSSQDSLSGLDKILALLGSGVGISFFVLYPVILANKFNKKSWQRIGIRIVGSWVAASSFLVLAFTVSKG